MKSLSFLLLACLLTVGSCASQTPDRGDTTRTADSRRERPSAEDRAARQAEELTGRLLLDEETAERAEEIIVKYARRNEALMNSSGDRRSKIGELRENATAQDREMEEILTEEQYGAYEELRQQQRAQMRERMQQRGGRGRRG